MVKKPSFSGPQPKQSQTPEVVARPEEPKTAMTVGAPLATSESLDAPLGPLVTKATKENRLPFKPGDFVIVKDAIEDPKAMGTVVEVHKTFLRVQIKGKELSFRPEELVNGAVSQDPMPGM